MSDSPEAFLASLQSESAPSSSESPSVGATPEAAPPQTPWYHGKEKEPIEYVIKGGKKVAEPLEMVLKRAGMGYNYAQDAHALAQKWEQIKSIEERNKSLSRWEEYDKYASENPDWAKHVEETWNNRTNLQQGQNGELLTLKQQLEELKKFKDDLVQEKTKVQQSAEDKNFADEIETVAKTFEVDLSQADENGQTLEWRVLEHMKQLGLDGSKKGHFEAAFKNLQFEHLAAKREEKAKEKYAKSQAELKRAGIREIASKPSADNSFNGLDPSKLSWNQLSEMALHEMRQTKQ